MDAQAARARRIAPASLGGTQRAILKFEQQCRGILQDGRFGDRGRAAKDTDHLADHSHELRYGVDAHVEERAHAGLVGVEEPEVASGLAEAVPHLRVVDFRSAVAGPAVSAGDRAYRAGSHHLASAVSGIAKVRQAKDGPIRPGDRLRERIRLRHVAAERLLHQDVLAGLQRFQTPADVQRVRERDDDPLDGVVRQQFLVVAGKVWHIEPLGQRAQPLLLAAGQAGGPEARRAGDLRQVQLLRDPSGADNADV